MLPIRSWTALTNFVYRWYINNSGSTPYKSGIDASFPLTNSYSLLMDSDKAVWLLYSRPYNVYDNAGDIDQDQLPDRWEMSWFNTTWGAQWYSETAAR